MSTATLPTVATASCLSSGLKATLFTAEPTFHVCTS